MLFRQIKILFTALCSVLCCLPSSSWAGLRSSLLQTAPVQPVGSFEARLHNDIIFNRGGGYNISPQLSTGLWDPYVDVTGLVAAGTTDFQMGLLGKFNLLPDLEGQVGVSFLTGYIYSRDLQKNAGTLNFTGLVSKKFDGEHGPVTPYGAVQLENVFVNGDSTVPITGIVGSKWEPLKSKPWVFYSEFQFQIRKSVYALSVGAGYPF